MLQSNVADCRPQCPVLRRQILGQSVPCSAQGVHSSGNPKHAFKAFRFPTSLEPMSLWGIEPGSLWLAVNPSNHLSIKAGGTLAPNLLCSTGQLQQHENTRMYCVLGADNHKLHWEHKFQATAHWSDALLVELTMQCTEIPVDMSTTCIAKTCNAVVNSTALPVRCMQV